MLLSSIFRGIAYISIDQAQGRGHMSNSCSHCNCDHDHVKVKRMTLDDGRHAERHTSVDANGNEVVEVFAEEARPLKLEKRIHREYKNVLSKETHETIKDGEVAHVEVHAGQSDVPLRIVDRIGIADHAKIVDGDYVRKEEIGKFIEDGVTTGIAQLLDSFQPVAAQSVPEAPKFRAQAVVENNVDEKSKNEMLINIGLGVLLLAQVGFFCYMFFVMA